MSDPKPFVLQEVLEGDWLEPVSTKILNTVEESCGGNHIHAFVALASCLAYMAGFGKISFLDVGKVVGWFYGCDEKARAHVKDQEQNVS